MLAAYGSGWFSSLKECADAFLEDAETYQPISSNVIKYQELFHLYKNVYKHTRELNHDLMKFRK
ncbi:xylulose kinase [Gracilibacillus boraciitolerans JCM 21714]|uniref:Xylulose kinase n=1 Tax=Gracilibacillus boraciitolerans JCM 21714 TaxID=1298598 RepID=W4VFL1_9BACI|nr:xylulose kinase [Gracilibacillus boraciitolerans JCM 21714]